MHDAFHAFGQVGQVTVHHLTSIVKLRWVKMHHLTSISSLSTIHEDICHIAEEKGVATIILPFHKRWGGEDEDAIENIGQGWNSGRKLIKGCFGMHHAQLRCLLIMAALAEGTFNDQEQSHNTSTSSNNWENDQKELDEVAVNEFKTKWLGAVEYIENDTANIADEILAIGRVKEYELVIVGKGHQLPDSTMMIDIKDSHLEHAELGPIGDLLTSSGQGITSSVLVIQDQDQHFTDSSETIPRRTSRAKSIVINTISESSV
ncbi:cation H(+) antiporter 20-like protein [Trifolium pratense]|uniref:Cation H(+) antiporter 20-like protein n=1 Tax=Trifolium pratense TaxID=57577 RepID=A0A2K3NVW9_TRIPR|nr:cation H(+) antiporter 20-like protein [Trifolium pratense]